MFMSNIIIKSSNRLKGLWLRDEFKRCRQGPLFVAKKYEQYTIAKLKIYLSKLLVVAMLDFEATEIFKVFKVPDETLS